MTSIELKRARNARWRLKHKEQIKINHAKWRSLNPDKWKSYAKSYRERHRDKIRDYCRNNSARMRALSKSWRKTHPPSEIQRENEAQYRKRYRKVKKEIVRSNQDAYRARKLNTTFSGLKTIVQWQKRWRSADENRCYWCMNIIPTSICQADHIFSLAKGGPHSIENLCISCRKCNQRRSAKPLSVWNREIASPVLEL